MIPYFEVPAITIGRLQIHAFGVLAAIALGVSYFSARRRVQRVGMDVSRVPGLLFWILVAGAGGALLLRFVTGPGMTGGGASLLPGGGAALGGLTAGLAGGCLYLWQAGVRGPAFARYLDALAFVLPQGWAFFRLGCAVTHDHPGARTASWLGVQYPGGPRFDLGLLELLCTLGCLGMLAFLDRARRPPGFYSGLLPLAYGVCRLVLDPLRDPRIRYFGWTMDQWFASLAIVAGLAVLAVSVRNGARDAEGLPLPSR